MLASLVSTAARMARESFPRSFATAIFLTCSGVKLQRHGVCVLAGRSVVGLRALHNVLVDRNDANVVKNGFASERCAGVRLVVHLGQHDIHIITRPDQARDARTPGRR